MTRGQFTFYVQNCQGALRRFLTALCCGDSALADDIAQEAFIKAYLNCDSINDPEKFSAWVFKIAYNTFLNSKRAQKITEDYAESLNIATESSSDSAFEYQELYLALAQLPQKERSAVLLFYLEDYSVKEISQTTGLTQDAIKQQLSRGRKHLRETLLKLT